MNKMEIFKNNLEEAGFTEDFIIQSLSYFNEISKEGEIQGLGVEDTLSYFNKIGSFTCNALQSFYNLHNFREDLYKLYQYDTNNILNPIDFFQNIEKFEIQVLYTLYFEFYPQEEINWKIKIKFKMDC